MYEKYKYNHKSETGFTTGVFLFCCLLARVALGGVEGENTMVAAHAVLHCSDCHGWQTASRQESAEPGSLSAEGGSLAQKCHGCHQEQLAAAEEELTFHDQSTRDCRDCHSFHEPASLTAGGERFAYQYGSDRLRGHCYSCHGSEGNLSLLSDGHRRAASLYHIDASALLGLSPSQGCLRCHSNQNGIAGRDAMDPDIPTFNEHASHPYGLVVAAGRGNSSRHLREEIDSRLPLLDQRLECQTCHQVAGETEDLLIPFAAKYDLCLGCHRFGSPDPDL